MRITVKIGSNVLTRADGTLDVTRMSSLVDQIATLHKQGIEVIIISSGAVASGRSELKGKVDTRKMDAVDQRQLFSAVGQTKLMGKYYELLRDHGIACGQVLTTKESLSTRNHYLNQKNCMEVMLQEGVIPIVNENDTISVTELMFTDNDELSGLVATMMGTQMLIILSNIDGIYTGNPADPTSKLIPVISEDTDISEYIQVSKSSFGRGGMVTKHRIARKVASEGVEVIISNGKRDGVLLELVHPNPETGLNEIDPHVRCTRFKANSSEASSVKKWIAHSDSFSKGTLYINAGACEALLGDKAASLLPVGVTRIEGSFEADDIVRIKIEAVDSMRLFGSFNYTNIGVGRVTLSSTEAQSVIGQKGHKPIVHYDYLWLE